MPTSIKKLEKLLSSKGFLVEKYLTLNNICIFIQVISIKTAEIFMINISPKYNLDIKNFSESILEMEIINFENFKNLEDKMELEIEKKYTEIKLSDNEFPNSSDLKNKILEPYKKPINISKKNEGINTIKSILKQLERLKYCVFMLKYKLAISFNSFLCVLTPINTVECFYIKNLNISKDKKNILIITDLETIYEKDNIDDDIKEIKEGVTKILDKNQHLHIENLSKFIEKKSNIILKLQDIENKKINYQENLNNFTDLFKKLLIIEKENRVKLYELDNRASSKGFHNDIEISHKRNKINQELENIDRIKRQLLSNIFKLRKKLEHYYLTIDMIMFENMIMLDEIFKNLDLLLKI